MKNTNEGDSATSTAVEEAPETTTEPAAITDINGLTNLFSDTPLAEVGEDEQAPESEKKEETEENQEVEATEVTEEAEKSEETETEETETPEDQQEESTDVLLQQKKTINKLKKRVDKTTKRFKTAEEELEFERDRNIRLEGQLKEASQQQPGDSSQKTFAEHAREAESSEDLQDLFDKAERAEQWAEDRLDDLRESGEDTVEFNNTEFSKNQVKDLLRDARSAIKKAIPAQEQFFKQREEYDDEAIKTFDFLSDSESEIYQSTQTMMNDATFNSFINTFPEGTYLLGLIGEGIRAVSARKEKPAEKKEEAPTKKAASKQEVAPKVPGLESTIAPRKLSSDENHDKRIQAIRDKPSLGQNDLTQLFATQT